MANLDALIKFIQAQLDNSVTIDEIKKSVMQKGWTEEDFDQALREVTILLESKLLPKL